jgi:DNA-binding NtrC family response regulator
VDKKNILIVEDSSGLATTLARTLRIGSNGAYNIETCESGETAFHRLAKRRYHLIVSSFKLPGMNGLEFLTRVKNEHTDISTILMDEHNSQMVKSEAERIGSSFIARPFELTSFVLLVRRMLTPPLKGIKAPNRSNPEKSKNNTILIMDDDASICQLYSKVLTRAHFEVHGVTTMKDARGLLQKNRYEIFICDIHMGRARGSDLVKEFRDKLTENGTQVVMCSAYGQYRADISEMGADFFLEKPISLGTLLTLINHMMDNHHVRQAPEVKATQPALMRSFGDYSIKETG